MTRRTGPSRAVRNLVWERDGGVCVRCGVPVHGVYSLQHRRARGMGGTRRGDANSPANLILMCGSATTGCHGWVESHPGEAARYGYRITQTTDPAAAPVLYPDGWVQLDHDGRRTVLMRTETAEPVSPSELGWGWVC